MTGFLWAWLGSTKNSIERGGYNKIYSYIPFLNVFFFMKASTKPLWLFPLMFVPVLNFVVFSIVILDHLDTLEIYDKLKRTRIVLLYPIISRGVL